MNSAEAPCGTYNEAHTYTWVVDGTGTKFSFYILDAVYSDNTGSLEVKITPAI